VKDNPSLPFASTLCGACLDVCPVAIDIPTMLVHLRTRVVEAEPHHLEAAAMSLAAWTMRSPRRWTLALRSLRLGRPLAKLRRVPPPLSGWTQSRDLPVPPQQSFRDWWAAR
jgi:L-lactate dehydrogenase complex protein LldF